MDANWTDTYLAIAIGIISFGIGLNLKFNDFKRIVVRPKAMIVGLVSQIIILPLVAFAIIYFWPIDPVYKVGFILIAACPGGTTSNLVTFLLKGRVSLSVSLTAFNSLVILFTTPLFLQVAYNLFLGESSTVSLSFMDTFSEILYSVILPVAVGIVVNEISRGDLSKKLEKPMRVVIALLLISAVVILIFFDESGQSGQVLQNWHLLIPLLILNISTMLIGFWIPGKFNLDHETRYTIAIELGLQNSALAIFIANNVLDQPQMSLIAIIYGSFSLVTSASIAYALKTWGKRISA
ncbi:bile acid:sodium symporter family protein [Halocola ammonii]